MRKNLIALVLGAAVLAALLLLRDRTPPPVPPATSPTADAAAPAALVATAPSATSDWPSRVSLDAPPEPERTPPQLAFVRGRCVAGEDGTPLAGCTVTFDGFPANSALIARYGQSDWEDPEPTLTGADGRFEIAFVPPPPYQHSLDVQAPGRVPRTARWGPFRPGQVEDLGDIRLQRGHEVRGRVVDEAGVPLERVSIALDNLPLPIRAGMLANDKRSGRSGPGGAFTIEVPIPAGSWPLELSAKGLRLVQPDHVTVDAVTGAPDVIVVARRMPSISGTIVDEYGLPVAGVSLNAEVRRSGAIPGARSDRDGSFTIYAVGADPQPVRLVCDDPGPCEPFVDERLHEWGTTGLRYELRRALSFELTVVEKDTGRPVEHYAVRCVAKAARRSRLSQPRLSGEHPGGKVTVDKVWRGTNLLVVLPQDPMLAASWTITFEATDAGVPPMRIELERLLPFTVHVRTADGAPVSDSTVELILPGAQTFQLHDYYVSPGSIDASDPSTRPNLLLAEATSDATGSAALRAPPGDTPLILRVSGPWHLPMLRQDVVPSDTPVEVVVTQGGMLAGELAIPAMPADRCRLLLVPKEEQVLSFEQQRVRVATDGTFRSASLPPGGYGVVLQFAIHYRAEHSTSSIPMVMDGELATVQIEAGKTSEVTLDASRFAPGRVDGHVLLDGGPPSPARAFLKPRGRGTIGQFVLDADGRFEAPLVPPGSYRLGLVVGDFVAGPGDTILDSEIVEVHASEHVVHTFVLERRRLRLRVLDADGEPLGDCQATVLGRHSKPLRTDRDGWLVIEPAPDDEFRLRIDDVLSEPLQMPEGVKEAALDVRMPARR